MQEGSRLPMSFIKRLFKRKEKQLAEGTVVFLGLGEAGKTTILNRLIHGDFSNPIRTMGLNVDEFSYRKVKFRTFDLGGQDTFHTLWASYVQYATALVYVLDASNPILFPESYEALQNVLKYRNGYEKIKILSAVLNIKDILSIYDKVRVSAYKNIQEVDFTGVSE